MNSPKRNCPVRLPHTRGVKDTMPGIAVWLHLGGSHHHVGSANVNVTNKVSNNASVSLQEQLSPHGPPEGI